MTFYLNTIQQLVDFEQMSAAGFLGHTLAYPYSPDPEHTYERAAHDRGFTRHQYCIFVKIYFFI